MEGFEERTAVVAGARVRGLVGGPPGGERVVLVHGLGGGALNWALVAPELARTRRVLVVELPGHGRSDPLPEVPSLAPYAEAALGLAESEGLLPADVVGHSLGGLVAVRAAVLRPEAVRRLVLVSAAGISSTTPRAQRVLALVGRTQPARRLSPYWRAIGVHAALRRLAFGRWFAADPLALRLEAVEAVLSEVRLHTDTLSANRALTRDDPRRDLHLVRCPALVLWGAEDNQLPLEDAFDFARRLRAPLRVIAGCGHLPIVERPDACVDAIERFLA